MKRSGSCQDLRRLVLLCVAAAAISVFVSSTPPPLDRSAESQSAGHHSQDGSAANYSPGQGLAVAVPAVPATIAWGSIQYKVNCWTLRSTSFNKDIRLMVTRRSLILTTS